jgi:hypothetical protein
MNTATAETVPRIRPLLPCTWTFLEMMSQREHLVRHVVDLITGYALTNRQFRNMHAKETINKTLLIEPPLCPRARHRVGGDSVSYNCHSCDDARRKAPCSLKRKGAHCLYDLDRVYRTHVVIINDVEHNETSIEGFKRTLYRIHCAALL